MRRDYREFFFWGLRVTILGLLLVAYGFDGVCQVEDYSTPSKIKDKEYLIISYKSKVANADGEQKFLMAIKSNMLHNAALTPNVALEFWLCSGWSVEGEFNYAWWKFGNSRFHRIRAGGVEVRKWLGGEKHSPLTGWFVGVHGLMGSYDFMYGSVGQKSSRSGSNDLENSGLHRLTYLGGVTGGYSLPIGEHLNIEFKFGLGYLRGPYDKYNYDPEYNDYHYMESRMRKYFGPTKIGVSLSWLIGNGAESLKERRRR